MSTANNQLTRFPNGVETFVVDSNCSDKTANYTVVVNTDSGKVFTSKLDGVVFTLPAIALGETYTFINLAADGAAKLSISPNAADGIMYLNSAVDNKDLINTKATAKYGDYVKLAAVYTGATLDYWTVIEARGVWAKEA